MHLVKRCYKKHMEMHNLEPFELLGTPTWEVLWTLAQRLTLILGSLDLFTDTYFAGTMGLGGGEALQNMGRPNFDPSPCMNPEAQLCAPRERRKESGRHGGSTVSSDHFQ